MEKIRPLNKNERIMIYGTSFHGSAFIASVTNIEEIIGKSDYNEINFEWWRGIENNENSDIIPFVIYNWSFHRSFSLDEKIEWHVCGRNKNETDRVCSFIKQRLNDLSS